MRYKRVRIPWWGVTTFAVLLAAFWIAVSAGRDWDAAVIGVLAFFQALTLGAWVYYARRRDG